MDIPTNGKTRPAKSLDATPARGYNGRGPKPEGRPGETPLAPNVERLCQVIARIVRRLRAEAEDRTAC